MIKKINDKEQNSADKGWKAKFLSPIIFNKNIGHCIKELHACIQQQTPIFQRHHDEVYRHIHNDRKTDTYQSHFDELVPGGETCAADRFDPSSANLTAAAILLQQQQFSGSALKEQRETKNQC
ncbi:unnamed protein product [Onchocerca flexuosa]|uniref:Uncharacterized protein n=1 Tax=Onchocerca flexuosa TaxID=387005 RepID=A0A183H4H9_9BILA|nr:unnamed protein product [Onchocerca flexuosa]